MQLKLRCSDDELNHKKTAFQIMENGLVLKQKL